MKLLVLLGASALLWLGACNASDTATTAPAADEPAGEAPVATTLTNSLADVLASNDTLPYPVYSSFDEIEPLFTQQNDTVYVINFWATWCKPCVEELPYFERLASEMNGQPVKIVMISLDFKRDVPTKLRAFIEERPLELPVVALTDNKYNNWIDRVDEKWTGAIPVTIVYKGGLKYFYGEQFASYNELAAAVRQLL